MKFLLSLTLIALCFAMAQAQPGAPTSLSIIPLDTTVTVSTGYNATGSTSCASSPMSVVLSAGHGARIGTPSGSSKATWWNSTDYTDPFADPNAEIITICSVSTDTLTVARGSPSGGSPYQAATHNTGGKTYKIATFFGGQGSSSVILSFTDNASDETGFKVERQINGGSFVQVALLAPYHGGATMTYFDKSGDVTPGDSVTYKVRATNGSGDSAYSNTPTAVVLSSNAVPAAPTSVAATWTTTGVNVTWSHAAVGAWTTGVFWNPLFQVWRSKDAGTTWEEIGGAQNNGSYKDRQWAFSENYIYKVRGWHFFGFGPFSSPSSSVATASATSPVAAITANSTAYVGEPVRFSGSSSTYTTDPAFCLSGCTATGVVYPYSWDFGAGEDTGYNTRETVYAFRTAGVKTITLTVKNPAGTTDTEQHTVTVSDITVSNATPHACTLAEDGSVVSAVHRPTTWTGLQAAINAAAVQLSSNPLIELDPATDYSSAGSTILASNQTGTGWVTIRPLNYTTNFTNQKRVTDADVPNLGKIARGVTSSSDSIIEVAPHVSNPVHHYRFQGIQVKKTSATASQEMSDYWDLSGGTVASMPHHFILQHVLVDGDPGTSWSRMGVQANVAYLSILDSRIVNIKRCNESYAIFWNKTTGDIVFDNNHLYGFGMAAFGSGEDTGFGPNHWPRHITLRRSYLTRRAADETDSYLSTTTACGGGSFTWKNLYEQKKGEFVVVNGNMFGPTWSGAQPGSGILIKAVNQNWDSNYSTSLSFQASNNVFRNLKVTVPGGGAFDIQARDGETSHGTDLVQLIFVRNNLVFDGVAAGATKILYPFHLGMAFGEPVKNLAVEHNTLLNTGFSLAYVNGNYTGTQMMKGNHIIANNLWESGYISGTEDGTTGKNALDDYAKQYVYVGNSIEGGLITTSFSGLHASNKFPADIPAIAFTTYASRILTLSVASPYDVTGADAATDGLDRGANLTTLLTQLGGSSLAFGVDTTKAESGDWSGVVPPVVPPLGVRGRIDVKGRLTVRP